ncbi:Piso0_000120 [Millerozyma farinosa CBS 7064]|uniref:Piso0_000120 protein n=1 Tax=Pichia sorbitophila (strain ATCC MYA-4447 / BCRC 22081 / CBS 7064 / NBRC 10061 / NRRL Y-12695) TaxID=559304 RepID=G8YT50_PICSO|nr:Piso0_000120 [Millerozyma farinosa CBS 7064]
MTEQGQSHSDDIGNESGHRPDNEEQEIEGHHHIELIAHSILGGPLDRLQEDFESLGSSQYILLNRIRLIEERLESLKTVMFEEENTLDEKEVLEGIEKVKQIRKRLCSSLKTLDKVEKRVEFIAQKTGK